MELLRKEMERVGLNSSKEEKEVMNGKSNNSNKEQQKTMLRTPADLFDHPSFYSFVLDMPGIDAENIKVRVENGGILHVSGKKKKQKMGEGVKVLRVERRKARYMRKFTLADDASHENINASYKDGVLIITVPKNIQLAHPQHAQEECDVTTTTTTTTTTVTAATNVEECTTTTTITAATDDVEESSSTSPTAATTASTTPSTATTNEDYVSVS